MREFFEIPLQDEGKRLDQFLNHKLESVYSRKIIREQIESNGIVVNGKRIYKSRYLLKNKDRVELDFDDASESGVQPENFDIPVLYEDDHMMILNKPCGMAVHPGSGRKVGTVANALLGAQKPLSTEGGYQRPGIVHRLDMDTSGALIIAKSNNIHRLLSKAFSSRSISKLYLALVEGSVEYEEGEVDDPIGRDPRNRTKMSSNSNAKFIRDALTQYKVIRRYRYSTLLHIIPTTGRTHQIRVHLSSIGYPVLGDGIYGDERTAPRLMLHAKKLEFIHPITGEEVRVDAPEPDEFNMIVRDQENR